MQKTTCLSSLRSFYAGKSVLVTGHTGFKGSWLSVWLATLGARVFGCALPPDQGPHNLFERADVASHMTSWNVDIRCVDEVRQAFIAAQPEIVFHLAARALIQHGFDDPLGTFASNIMGTANVLEAARECRSVTSIVCVTTDKVYRNREWAWPYRETDELGGYDAYSASKAAAELIARAYQKALKPSDRAFALATARGGNVIGGGDWSPHRLVPDIVRAIESRSPLTLRFPASVRPWQHVLDLCFGYLLLGQRLAAGHAAGSDHEAWNFGPSTDVELTVGELVSTFLSAWGERAYPVEYGASKNYEAITLRLDPSRAKHDLGWTPVLDSAEAIEWTAQWYRGYMDGVIVASDLVSEQIKSFEAVLDGRQS